MISQMTVRVLACFLLVATLGAQARPKPVPSAVAQRQHWLEMFARAYYPGRSGQIMIVPKEGEFFVDRDPLYAFQHGSPWEYDTHIPLLFHGAPFVKKGIFREPARQQDVAPTIAAILGALPPATTTGHVLRSALASTAEPPRLIALIVMDAMRADYFAKHADVMPTLTKLKSEGAWFAEARVDSLPTATSVGHATIGTGTDPGVHGQVANNIYNRVAGKSQAAYDQLDVRELMAPTLADNWNIVTDGQAIIIGQGGAIRATAGLAGHGACQTNGRKIIAASYSTTDAGWETNPQCYTMSNALHAFNGKAVWEAAGGTWKGHDISSPTKFRASSLYLRFETDALLAVLDAEPIGADELTDLVFVNIKGTDYVAHAHGPDSPEMIDALGELDRQMAKLVDLLNRKSGGHQLIVMTADHGMPSTPSATGRHNVDDITELIHQRFDPQEKKLVQYFGDPANAQIYLDRRRADELHVTMKEVATFLEEKGVVAAAFAEYEVMQAASKLKR